MTNSRERSKALVAHISPRKKFSPRLSRFPTRSYLACNKSANEARMKRSKQTHRAPCPKDRPIHGHAQSEATLSSLRLLDGFGETRYVPVPSGITIDWWLVRSLKDIAVLKLLNHCAITTSMNISLIYSWNMIRFWYDSWLSVSLHMKIQIC